MQTSQSASVQHAEMLAAVLDNEGVPAASVSAFTPAAERRARVRQFQSGEIRVLTNYNVVAGANTVTARCGASAEPSGAAGRRVRRA